MIEFPKYAQIKDRFCLCYFGQCDDYLTLLVALRPRIEACMPGLQLWLGCRDDRVEMVGERSLPISMLKADRFTFAHIRELRYNGQSHPVEDFLDESGISIQFPDIQKEHTSKCVVVTKGQYPTKNLESDKVDQLVRSITKEGYAVEVDTDIAGAGLVVGVESSALWQAASKGIETRLVPTGIGACLYKKLIPRGTVLHR